MKRASGWICRLGICAPAIVTWGACVSQSQPSLPSARLGGRVVDFDSVPIAGASVLSTDWIASTDSLGSYSATLPPGRHVIRIHSNRLAWLEDTLDLVPGGSYRHDVQLPVVSPGWVKGRILGPDGAAIEGAQVVIIGTAVNVLSDSAGQFRFVVPVGEATIGAARLGHRMARKAVDVVSRQTTAIELRLERCPDRAEHC